MSNAQILNYSTIAQFRQNIFGDLLTIENIESKQEESVKIGEKEHYGFMFYVQGERKMYFFDTYNKHNEHILDKLPLTVLRSSKYSYRNRVFYHVENYESFRIIPKKSYGFRRIVDEVCNLKHNNSKDFLMWTIVCMASYLDKVMLRISSPKGFGKDSIAKILQTLLTGVIVAKPRTVAKLNLSGLSL